MSGAIELTKTVMSEDQIKDLIIEVVKRQKPKTTQQLILQVQQNLPLSDKQITRILIDLEDEGRLHFNKITLQTLASSKNSIPLIKAMWYWTIIALTVATAAVLLVPAEVSAIVYLRYVLGTGFIAFLPGYAFIKAVFPKEVPIKLSKNMDIFERVALSLGVSLIIAPTVALILNYSPWGVRLVPLTLSLLSLTIIFASIGALRECKTNALFENNANNL